MKTEERATDLMKCALCGYAFSAEQAQAACQSCPFHRKCRLIRCPNCGYETPARAQGGLRRGLLFRDAEERENRRTAKA